MRANNGITCQQRQVRYSLECQQLERSFENTAQGPNSKENAFDGEGQRCLQRKLEYNPRNVTIPG